MTRIDVEETAEVTPSPARSRHRRGVRPVAAEERRAARPMSPWPTHQPLTYHEPRYRPRADDEARHQPPRFEEEPYQARPFGEEPRRPPEGFFAWDDR